MILCCACESPVRPKVLSCLLRSDGFILFIEMLENPEISFVNQTKDVPKNDSEDSAFDIVN